MKKAIVLLIILVLLTQFVSAGFWDWVTGRVTEETENVTIETMPEETCQIIPESQWCSDQKTLCPMKRDEKGCEAWDCDACNVCLPIPETQFCSDQRTLCPQEKDEKGCPNWNCNACEIPPEEDCLLIQISMWCSDRETLCPQKKDEKGCVAWDCDSCEIPEEACPLIPESQWCSDRQTLCPQTRDEKGCEVWDCDSCNVCPLIPESQWCPDRETLCPMKRDEKGCSLWDCDSCVKPPPEEIICCKTWPIIPEPKYSYSFTPKSQCQQLKDGQPITGQGFEIVDESFCKEPPTEVPPGCKKTVLETGVEIIKCEKECPPLPEEAMKKCEETDGNAVRRFDPQGCPFIDCEYVSKPGFMGPAVECSTEDMLSEMEEKCRSIGIEPFIVKERGCKYVKCSGKTPEIKRCVEDIEAVKKTKEECEINNGKIVKDFDSKGCPMTVCAPSGEEFECEKSVPPEAHENCELEGGNLVIKRDGEDCIKLLMCTKRGNADVVYEEVEEIPSATKLLSIALKLENLKIQFNQIIRNLRGIVNYYEEADDTARAERFRKVLGLFSNANDKIEEVKVKLRERAEDITKEDLRDIKHDIKYISETVMQDALYIILGGEIEIEGSTGVIEEGYADCGNDNDCLEEALRLCEPAVLKLNENFAKIEGLEGEACILEVSFMGADMVCKIKDYATFRFEGRDLFQYCEGKGREVLKMFEAKITTSADWTLADCEGMIDSDKKERCYMAVASTTGDGSLCAKITDINIRENSCYFSIAWNIKDSSLCAKISDKNRRDNCYEGVAVALKDADICEQLLDSESEDRSPSTRFSEILCYNKVAIAAQDKSICERITKDDDDTRCYCKERTMELIGDDCYCEEITRDNNRAKCYAAVAKDASLCETITDEFTKDSCYSGVAQETKDSSLCERITTGQKDGCYYNLHDRSVCDKIINDQMREHCYGDTESIKSAPPEEKTITDEEAPTQTATGTTARVRRTIDGNVLYFYNNNCPHCERQGPIITEIEKNLGGLIKVERLDTEKESEIFAKYNINAVPSMVYIGSDGCTRIKMGYTEYDELKEWIYSDECAGGVS